MPRAYGLGTVVYPDVTRFKRQNVFCVHPSPPPPQRCCVPMNDATRLDLLLYGKRLELVRMVSSM